MPEVAVLEHERQSRLAQRLDRRTRTLDERPGRAALRSAANRVERRLQQPLERGVVRSVGGHGKLGEPG